MSVSVHLTGVEAEEVSRILDDMIGRLTVRAESEDLTKQERWAAVISLTRIKRVRSKVTHARRAVPRDIIFKAA